MDMSRHIRSLALNKNVLYNIHNYENNAIKGCQCQDGNVPIKTYNIL